MRLLRLLLGVLAVTALTTAPPAQAAGSMTSLCTYTDSGPRGDYRTGTLSSGIALANDGTSPEVICSVRTTPQINDHTLAVRSARGIACIESECKGDYWVCYDAECYGDGFVCLYSECYSGSVCYQSTCTPPEDSVASSPATRLSPTAVEFWSPQATVFTCTQVRWHDRDGGYTESFFGCVAS